MKCPKCNSDMEKTTYAAIEVDRCTGCQGIWFDQFEAEDLKNLKGAESIDIGDANQGKDFNKIADIDCPKCHTKMIKMVDNQQHHIWYEGCTSCYGLFFDAGEFADYKEENFLDFFKDLLTPARLGDQAKKAQLGGDEVGRILS